MTLAKLATVFAVVFLLSIGVCGYSVSHSSAFAGVLNLSSAAAMVLSFFGLIAVGFVALFRILIKRGGS
jgi:hypothetical protein